MRRQLDGYLQSRAGIEPGSVTTVKIHPAQSGWSTQRAIATDKFFAITGRAGKCLTRGAESNPLGEFVVEGVARKYGR